MNKSTRNVIDWIINKPSRRKFWKDRLRGLDREKQATLIEKAIKKNKDFDGRSLLQVDWSLVATNARRGYVTRNRSIFNEFEQQSAREYRRWAALHNAQQQYAVYREMCGERNG